VTPPSPIARPAATLPLLAAALSAALLLPLLGLPVYFRTDDVHWLGWAASHANPLSAFDPGENLFGYFRPLPTLLWWVLFRLFGFEPLGYQIALAALGVATMVPLFRLGARLVGGASASVTGARSPWGGAAAVALFHLVALPLLYYYFWFSALTFAVEMLFLALALDALTDGRTVPGRPIRFVVFALLAGLSKQPALLVIPAVAIPMLMAAPGSMRSRLRWGVGIAAIALVLMGVTPFVAQRPEALGRLLGGDLVEYLTVRWNFYAGVLLRGFAGPIAAAAALVALTGARTLRPALGAALAGALLGGALRFLPPGAALIPWLLLLVAAAWRCASSRPWLLGFLLPAAALLGVDFYVSTYLLEPLLALTPALLLWLRPLATPLGERLEAPAARWRRPMALAAPALALLAAFALHDRVGPIVAMRDVRAVFRQAVDFVRTEAGPGAAIGYLTYEELGESYADIRAKPLDRRVERHKTMNGPQLDKFLGLTGRDDLNVVPVSELPPAGERWLLGVNAIEREILSTHPGAREVRRFDAGGAEAVLFRIFSLAGPELVR
jgi:hypothetical protein